jgi:NAD(P)-dependent dehydrogenase (short-subunit alcohol dehydrogenase family)
MLLDIPFGSDMDSGRCVQKIFETTKSKEISFSEIQEIIYFPGYQQHTENLDTEEVYHCIKTSCLVLLKLLQKFMEESIDIPILVLTQQTQPHITEMEHKYNLAGSELWGMCRCLVRERTYSNVRLVDFTEDKDLELLPIIIVKAKEDEFWKYAPEFKVSDNKMYVNQVFRYNNDSFGFRMNSYNKKQSLELKSASHDNLRNLFFVPKSALEITETTHVSLNVETAYTNPIFSPLTTTIAVDDPDPWKATRADGHQIIATEVCGRIEGNNNILSKENTLQCLKSPKVTPTDSHSDISYATCFPSGVSNTMSVPSRCLIPKRAFHEYRPGMMHEYIWYFALLEELKIGGPLGIIYEKGLPFDLNLLQEVLRSSKRKVTFVYDTNEFRDKYNMNGKYQLLLLVQDVSALMNCSSKINLAASRIVTYSQLVNKPQERLLRQQWPNLDFCIINNDDMLSEQKLSKLVKVLTIWLYKNHRLQKGQFETEHYSNGTTIDFLDATESTTNINCEDCSVKTNKASLFNKSAGYMIIGGLTGLGWETVELIAKMGGGCVVILARRQPTDQRLAEMKEMSEKYNCQIISLRADVSDFKSVKIAFETYHSEYHDYPLKGIFHGAAVVDDAIIVYMTEEKFEKVLKPKIKGTLNLHILSKDMKLDYFILHSSITSFFGNTGQVNYGAGNSFMDTFAYYRRSNGLSGQTINWGALHLGLLTASEHVERHLNAQGYHTV